MTRHVKGFVFVATTGRSGTLTLAQVLSAVPRCVTMHEPKPVMHKEVLRRHNRGDDALMWRTFRLLKRLAIYKAAARGDWYVETNHLFIKSFCEATVAEFGERLQVLHLVRDPHAVTSSLLGRGSIPGTPRGDKWLGHYRAPLHEIQVADLLDHDPRFSHPYFKVLWYWYEIEARTARFRLRHPEVPVYDFKTEDFNDADALHAMCRAIFGTYDEAKINGMVGTRAHASQTPPQLPAGLNASDLEAFEAQCQAQLEPLLQRVKEASSPPTKRK